MDNPIPRKRCPQCHAVFEGEGVKTLYSCDQCGNSYLSTMPDKTQDGERMPRHGGGSIFHTRDNY